MSLRGAVLKKKRLRSYPCNLIRIMPAKGGDAKEAKTNTIELAPCS